MHDGGCSRDPQSSRSGKLKMTCTGKAMLFYSQLLLSKLHSFPVYLTLDGHAREGYSYVCVCVSLKSGHLENTITYPAGNRGQNFVFSETAPLQRSSAPSVVTPYIESVIFLRRIWNRSFLPGRERSWS